MLIYYKNYIYIEKYVPDLLFSYIYLYIFHSYMERKKEWEKIVIAAAKLLSKCSFINTIAEREWFLDSYYTEWPLCWVSASKEKLG